ncbi:hypothetical protein A9G36_03130 [Gilliamella sp. Choc6-1]|uniref:DUF2732 family protein n=1 Tax=unclassified Gilliamella TaxID=2685620 RepID=UPI00080EE5DD|nr:MULTISPECIES: DUF2732 family protein [Gilliamella]MCO6549554.1 DUF2732 family protein [Gilliamella sp.]MCO6555855.1 DUF2732 family protein [Gilliamella sp.]OCG56337.1 hypothetical protein A9G36_03130 [Gilliamella apicola]
MDMKTEATPELTRQLLVTINNAKRDLRQGLCDVFTTKLERLAAHIRTEQLTAAETAELLRDEAEFLREQMREEI